MKKTLAATALTAGALVMSFASPALADPTDVNPGTVNGSGSDTTEVVMRALDAGNADLASWDVTGAVPYDTNGAAAGCSFGTRIAGSGAGRTALANSVTLGDGCWQFARSSSRAVTAAPGTTAGTYTASGAAIDVLPITLATDALTYVLRAGSSTPKNLTLGQLRAIYSCTFTGTVDGLVMSSPTVPNKPLLPADASGSRADWLALMGLPNAPAGAGVSEVVGDGGSLPSCIDDGPGDSPATEYSEHNGNVLTSSRQIILHSIPQYLAQGRGGSTPDFRGLSVLGYINGNTPLQLFDNPAGVLSSTTVSGSTIVDGALFRPVYNIVPASQVADPTIVSVFGVRSGGTSTAATGDAPNANSGYICNQDALLVSNGFTPAC